MIAAPEGTEVARAAEFSLVARRNNSLTHAGRSLVFVFIFAGSVGIAAAFAAVGAWLILPFAGIEMLALYLAFRCVDSHAADYECIAIDGDTVKVEFFDGGHVRSYQLSRYWAQVTVSRDGGRLALRSHGRELEIGRYLSDEQRLDMARELKRRLRATG